MSRAAAAALLCAGIALFSPALQAEDLLAVGEAWIPYMGPDLPDQGFLPALVKGCFAEYGRQVRVEFYPWARALAAVKEGKADILLGAYKTEEREAWFEFSAPVAEVSDSLFALKRSGPAAFRDLRELSPYVVGVVRGAAHGTVFDGAGYLKKEAADSNVRNIEKLIAGRVRLIAGPSEVIRSILAERFPSQADEIAELRPPLQSNPVHFAFSKRRADAAELAKSADAAIEKMKESGAYAALAKRHGIRP